MYPPLYPLLRASGSIQVRTSVSWVVSLGSHPHHLHHLNYHTDINQLSGQLSSPLHLSWVVSLGSLLHQLQQHQLLQVVGTAQP